MHWLSRLFHRRKQDTQLDSELRYHVEQQTADNIAAGMDPGEARRRALAQFGGLEYIKEEARDARGTQLVETLVQDIRYGLRMLRKSPGFTAIAILTLALGIGANTAIFSFTDQVLLSTLPVPNPQQLVVLRSPGRHNGSTWSDIDDGAQSFSYPVYKELRDRAPARSEVLAYRDLDVNVAGHGITQSAHGVLVSGNYFQTLEVPPALGRVFSASDETASGANPVAVLSYAYWMRHFGGDPSILNKPLTVNGTALTVVGIARKGFSGVQIGDMPDIFIPVTMKVQMMPEEGHALEDRGDFWIPLMARLKPGITRAQAQAELQPIYASLLEEDVKIRGGFGKNDRERYISKPLLLVSGSHGRAVLQSNAEEPLLVLMGMVGLVLLIACANLASLLVARGEARQRDIALRLALGASRGRLIRQLLTESLLIAVAGGAAGVALASWCLRAMVGAIPASAGMASVTTSLSSEVLWFAVGVTVATSMLFGLAPALRTTRVDLQSTLKDQGSSVSEGRSNIRLRKTLIVSQVAFTAVLLVAAGLLGRTLTNLERANLGVKTGHVLEFSASPDLNGYTPEQTQLFADHARQQIAALPGVRSVAASSIPIFSDDDSSANITPEGYVMHHDEDTNVQCDYISPDYFSTMGIPLISGREFTDADTATSGKVIIINEKLAQRFFAGKNPLGFHIAFGAGDNVHPDMEIVGVVADSKWDGPRDTIQPFLYQPYRQNPRLGNLTFYVRTEGDPVQTATAVHETMQRLDANLPVNHLETLRTQISDEMFNDRLTAILSISLAGLAALLAALGVYGVLAYVVARRTREIGIRMALGAQRDSVLWLVLAQGAQLAVIGGAIGFAGALGVTQFAGSLLYGVSTRDPLTFAGVFLLLLVVVGLACYLPARRAMRVDPMVALRYE
ncbi:MAG TPA: ABC transporter permease [Candidatus Acidoferrum sp.]|nr:ABC transporter permease [Candidatus Acidoferrum sp.]